MPRAVRVASALFVAYGVVGLTFVVVNWLLRGHAFAWTSLTAVLLAALNFWIAVMLRQLRYWALLVARLLTLWLAAGYITLFATRRFPIEPPIVTLATFADVLITAALVITLFLPGVRKAFPAPRKSESA
jgi:hypothetical protein